MHPYRDTLQTLIRARDDNMTTGGFERPSTTCVPYTVWETPPMCCAMLSGLPPKRKRKAP